MIRLKNYTNEPKIPSNIVSELNNHLPVQRYLKLFRKKLKPKYFIKLGVMIQVSLNGILTQLRDMRLQDF